MGDVLRNIVIVGAGQAAATLAGELRRLGYAGALQIVGDEPHPPYKRPPLSKAYLSGEVTTESLHVMTPAALDKANIEFIGGSAVTAIHRDAHEIELADGRRLGYDGLALCLGGRARPLPLDGADAENVHHVRTIHDVDRLREQIKPGGRVVIVGGGFIGLEMAAVLVKGGAAVTVLEGLPRVLARVAGPQVSAFYARVHREAGVILRTDVQVTGLEGHPRVTHVVLGNGEKVEADVVIVGIGLLPNVELARDAGLEVDNGIVVDDHARTSDPAIVAAGDCASHPNAHYARRLRLESVPNAMEQARTAAATLLGESKPYASVPWFWSDQYDLKLQMVGLSNGYDACVLRGNPETARSFVAFYLKDGRIIAADAVSALQDFAVAKALVAKRAAIAPEILADVSQPLKTLLETV